MKEIEFMKLIEKKFLLKTGKFELHFNVYKNKKRHIEIYVEINEDIGNLLELGSYPRYYINTLLQINKNLLFLDLNKWSKIYDFNFQFWGEGNNNVFIYKNDIEIFSSGDNECVQESIYKALNFINKINNHE